MSLNNFYNYIYSRISSHLKHEIIIHNKINNTQLSLSNDEDKILDTIIALECDEISIIVKPTEDLITLADFVRKSNDVDVCKVLLQILISFYRLKNKLHLVLGNIEIDYNIYIDTKQKSEWFSFMEDKYRFGDSYKVYFFIINPVHYHYKDVIYLRQTYNNKYSVTIEDSDIYDLYNYILSMMNRSSLFSYLLDMNLFGKEHKNSILDGKNISNLIINKTKNLKDIYNMFLTLYTFDKSIQKDIRVDNKLEIKKYNVSMSSNPELYNLYNDAVEKNYNMVEIFNNMPKSIEYTQFDTDDMNKEYTITNIIDISLQATKIFTNFKRYFEMVNNNDLVLYKKIMKRYHSFNHLLYNSLLAIYSQMYYLLFNFDDGEYVLYYYLENIKNMRYFKEFLQDINVKVGNNYRPTFTLEQIKTLYNKDKQNTIYFIVKKIYNISERQPGKEYQLTERIILNAENDIDIYYNLSKYVPSTSIDFEKRGEVRVNQLSSVFESKFFRNNLGKLRYLDYGGGEGEITAAIAKHIGSTKENSFIVDVEEWFGNVYNVKYADILTYKTIRIYQLPFDDNSLDFITCFQVLHHIKDYKKIISEFYSILRPGGLLVLREHDCRDEYDRMLIDMEHSIYETTLKKIDKTSMLKYLSGYEAYYMSRDEWNQLFIKAGFKNITDNINSKLSEPKTPARYYFEVYTK